MASDYRGLDFAALFPFSEDKRFQFQNVREYKKESKFRFWVRIAYPIGPASYWGIRQSGKSILK